MYTYSIVLENGESITSADLRELRRWLVVRDASPLALGLISDEIVSEHTWETLATIVRDGSGITMGRAEMPEIYTTLTA